MLRIFRILDLMGVSIRRNDMLFCLKKGVDLWIVDIYYQTLD